MKQEIGLKSICATDLKPKPISWIWNNWLALGKLHLLAGAAGTGKTTLALSLAATITSGGQWPDGSYCEPGNILIWSDTDDLRDTLLPRLLAHGADRQRVYFISGVFEHNKVRAFDPSKDMQKLCEKVLSIMDVRLIVIDPIGYVISRNPQKNGEIKRALQHLIELGDKLKAVIIGISHFNKNVIGCDHLERAIKSIACGTLTGVVLATTKIIDPRGKQKRLFMRAKSNHGIDSRGYYYKIEQISLENYPDVLSSKIIWGDPVEANAQGLLVDTNKIFK